MIHTIVFYLHGIAYLWDKCRRSGYGVWDGVDLTKLFHDFADLEHFIPSIPIAKCSRTWTDEKLLTEVQSLKNLRFFRPLRLMINSK